MAIQNPMGINAAPTPFPPQGYDYNANQSQPGGVQWVQPANNASYGGSSYNDQGQIISTPQNPTIKTPTNPQVNTQPVVTAPTGGQSNNGLNGFDMKYYVGWNQDEAQKDWIATGGAKGRSSQGPGGYSPTIDKRTSTRGDVRANSVVNNPTANAEFEASGMNMDDYLASIDQEANSQNSMLGGYEATANADKLAAEQNLAGQAQQLKNKALTGKEDALSAARRLYSELQQGYKQRFGGASSAGEAAMALTGNEQQRQMAQTNRGYQDTINQIDQQSATALNTVQSEFRSRIDQINQNRTLVESQRLQARRGALQDLANKAYAIKQQQDAFKQNIALMQAQIDMQAKANNAQAFNVNPTSTLTTGNIATTASGNQGLTDVNSAIGKVSSGTFNNNDLWNKLGVGIPGLNY